MNEEVKGWTYSSKQQETLLEPTNTKEDIRLEYTRIKVNRAALEWDDLCFRNSLNP